MEVVNHVALGIAWMVEAKRGGGATNPLRKARVRKEWGTQKERCGSRKSA